MKRAFTFLTMLAVCALTYAQGDTPASSAKTWSLTTVPQADVTNIKADATNWKTDSKSRYCHITAIDNAAVTANAQPVSILDGLKFTIAAGADGNLRLGGSTKSLWLGDATTLTIPSLTKDKWVKIEYLTSKSSATRSLSLGNVTGNFPASSGKTHQTGVGKVTADGDVTVGITGGMYIYNIVVGDSADVAQKPTGGDTGGEQGGGTGDDKGGDQGGGTGGGTSDPIVEPDPSTVDPNAIYVSPTGSDSNAGTREAPMYTIEAASKKLPAGGTLYMLAGTYKYNKKQRLKQNGTAKAPYKLMSFGGRAVMDMSGSGSSDYGLSLEGSYWYIYQIDICNAGDNGLIINASSNDVIEQCNFYKNGDSGLQMKEGASWVKVINCDSYQNCDKGQGNADGFAPKLSIGDGNYLYGCRAWCNSDDGFDYFYKTENGHADGVTVVVENSITYMNGYLDTDGTLSEGNGSGFKCGSKQGATNAVFKNCLAVNNHQKGFDQNHNLGANILINCTGMQEAAAAIKPTYRFYETSISGGNTMTAEAKGKQLLINCVNVKDAPGQNAAYWGADVPIMTSITSDTIAAPSNFVSVIPSKDDILAKRLDNGDLPNIQCCTLKEGSKLIDAGTVIPDDVLNFNNATKTHLKQVVFNGAAPDLGWREFGQTSTAIQTIGSVDPSSKRINVVQAHNGMVVLDVDGSDASDEKVVIAYDAAGRMLGTTSFYGTSTGFNLPYAKGFLVLKVIGNNFNESIKITMK